MINASTSTHRPLASTSSRTRLRSSTNQQNVEQGSSTDLWNEILSSADRRSRGRGVYGRKNIILLSERHRGRTYLLNQLSRKGSKRAAPAEISLAMGYEIVEVREDGDEDSVPPLSVFYPPSSEPALLDLVPRSLPPDPLPNTAVVILLDWSRPSTMIKELLVWLHWVEQWARNTADRGQADEMRERLQSHIQHYTEPASSTPGSTLPPSLTTYSGGPLLPLGPGSLTLNHAGIPIVVVCTRADLMDTTGEEVGMKGQWEERTDWVQQVLRTICLAYGAGLFYTAPTQPQTYTLLRQYLLHRLYTVAPPLNPSPDAPPPPATAFPFSHRANVLDRDAVMVPTGWDSHGKINVLRDRFDPMRVLKAWENSLSSLNNPNDDVEEGETVEDMWIEMIPDTSKPKPPTSTSISTTVEPEQSFLTRQLETLQKDPNRDPRASFRTAAAAVSASAAGTSGTDGSVVARSGVVGPMGSGGLSLPGVEKVMAEMEGGSAEDLKEKFARLGRRETTRPGPLSPSEGGGAGGAKAGTVPNEALHSFFQGLLATKGKSGTPAKSPSTAVPPKATDKE